MMTRGHAQIQPDPGTPLLFDIERETTHLGDRRQPVTTFEAITIRWTVDGRTQSVRAILAAPLELEGLPT